MYPDTSGAMCFLVSLALLASSEAFFLKWGSDSTPVSSQKAWMQSSMPTSYRYQYPYYPYEPRKVYQVQQNQYAPQQDRPMQQSMTSIPISVPAGASLTPVSLQHVQLVPCMCPVAPEEAEKLQEQVGPGPYLAQTYQPAQPSYAVAQQIPSDTSDGKSGSVSRP